MKTSIHTEEFRVPQGENMKLTEWPTRLIGAANIDTGNHGCNCGFPRFNGSNTLVSGLTSADSTSLD